MKSDDEYLPFSQRMGLANVPPQLKVGEVSEELRRIIDYAIQSEVERQTKYYTTSYFTDQMTIFAKDIHVLLFKNAVSSFDSSPRNFRLKIERIVWKAELGGLFDLVEFLIRHSSCSDQLKKDLTNAFLTSRAAYRIFDDQIVVIGTDQQGEAFEKAINEAERVGAEAARYHLIAAGQALRNGDWSGSVRDSIHSVEAMALRFAPGEDTLGPALKQLENKGYIHRSLKAAFGSLYGYSSDEKGIRHARVFDNVEVDEADALFMLGACASFVSYLISKENKAT